MLKKHLKKFPKRLLLLCLAIALVLPIVACNSGSNSSSGSSNTDSSSGSQAAEKKTFTVGFDASFPPYGYRDDNGEYVGFDLDLAQEVCNRRGWTLVKQPIDWDSKDMELSAKTIDCIWNGFTMSEERLDKYTWTEPYVDNSQVFVVAKDSGIKTFDDLAGKTVAVQAASSALEALESDDCKKLTASFKSLEQIPEYNTAFMNLEAKSVDAIAMDIGVAKYQIESRGDNFVMLSEPIITEKYGIAFLKGNETLRDEVQSTLYDMLKDGKLDEIAKKWELSESVIFGNEKDAK